jgi:hypothetical protein
MESKPPRQNVVQIPIGSVIGPMMDKIRAVAAVSANVFISPHARERMEQRGITDVEVIRVLRTGDIAGLPWHEPEIGGRACKVVFQPRGSRAIGVITVVLEAEELLVKSVEWEDER